MFSMTKSLWAYRGFIHGNIKREFQSKYRNSLLGATWTILNPLAMIIIYTVIFAGVMKAKLPGVDSTFAYSIYLCAGTLTWGLFVEIITRCQNMFIDNANLLKKISFPRLCLPVTVVANSLLNFSIVFGLFTAFLIISGNFPGLAYLALIPLLILLIAFAAGLGMVLGVLNVFFRDIGQFFTIFISFWFWLTPIVYPLNILSGQIQAMMKFNPMANFMLAVQTVLVRGQWPHWEQLSYIGVLAIVLCWLGLRLFRRHVGEMIDEL